MVLRKVGKILLYCAAGFVGLILLLMLAVKLALDRAPQYQAQIKDWVQQRVGYHIEFTHVSPAFRWYGPELYFERLELRSKDGRRELARAAGGRIGIDLWQLIRSGKLFAGRIELDAPTILVARIGPDKFALASEIVLGGGNAPLSMKLDDLPAGTLAIRHGVVTLQDWNTSMPQLELRDVDLQLRRRDDGATLKVDARWPALLGGLVAVDAQAEGSGDLKTLRWTARARTRDLSFAGWRQLLPEFLSRLGAGTGGFEAAASGQGATLARADIDFGAKNVVTQLTDEPGVNFEEISGVFTVSHADDRWALSGRHVQAMRAARRDPESEFDASWRGGDEGLLELQARASYLRAEALLPLAGLLPQKDLRERLQELAPTGEWQDTHVALKRAAASEPWQLDVQARFRGVGFAPSGRTPGLRGLNGTLTGTADGGRIDIDTQRGTFTWPTEFPQPVGLENLKTTLYWKRTPGEFLVATPSIDLKTRDAAVHAQLAWHQPTDGGSPVLVLASVVNNGNVANTRLYLPRTHIAPSGLTWLNRAFLAGRLSHADVVIQGPIRHYPFRDGAGVFLARAHIEGMTLDYKEGWPRAENLDVVAEFRNEGLNVRLVRGRIGALDVESGDARFVDFKNAELQVHAVTSGDAGDMLAYLRATPLDELAEHVFSSVEAKGPMQSDVDLFLPFNEFEHRRTRVHAHLHGVSLNRVGSPLTASELTGDADIDGAQVSRADVRGKVLGGSFQMQARAPRNRPVTRTILVFNGILSGDALHSALSLPASIPLDGTTDWHGVLRMAPAPARERSLRLNGSLAGLDLNLPEPLAKPAGRALPSSVEIQWPVSGGPLLRFALGSVLRGQVALDDDANGPRLARAAVTFGPEPASADSTFSDSQVVNTGGAIGRLDLGGWLKLYTPDKSAKPLGNFLRTAKFEVARIDYLGLSFLDVSLNLAASDTGWRIGVGGPNVIGSITLPGAAEPAQPWKLEFERLKFVDGLGEGEGHAAAPAPAQDRGSAGPSGSGSVAAPAANPRGIPDINFHAAQMIWGERQFGDVAATLAKLDDGISLKQLTVTAANFSASATGEWRGKDAGTAHIDGTLSSTDVGATMRDLGYDAVIEAKTGKVDFDMGWLGAPTGAALSLATGHVRVALDKGQLTGIKPGAGRVMGLASLAALPRRLALDFSDLTDKGLAFDTIRGDFALREGSAFTDDVLVKGPAAEIGLIGRVGLKSHDYDQTAVVTGNVSSTLPLAAFVAGPVIGGAVLLFTQVFKQPLRGLTRGYYRITGSWDSPTVERIKSADAAASAEAPK
jgi:uncharacterized protein (TIGR02099 family)